MTYVMSTRCKKIIIDCFLLNLYLPIVVDLASKDRILHASTFMYSVGLTNTTLNENLEDTDGEKSNRTRKRHCSLSGEVRVFKKAGSLQN